MWPFSSAPAASDAPQTCPVDHTTMKSAPGCPVDHSAKGSASAPPAAGGCPVDHSSMGNPSSTSDTPTKAIHSLDTYHTGLSTEREVSTIPRFTGPVEAATVGGGGHPEAESACPVNHANTGAKVETWVYPSPASFYSALKRKNQNPQTRDMNVVVPIHNAVNERVWSQLMDWEMQAAPEVQRVKDLGIGTKLVSFVGKPKELTPKARLRSLFGYTEPFDRHDWIVDRPLTADPTRTDSIKLRYVIDFYTGKSTSDSPYSFYIDCRPALDSWEGVKMRARGLFTGLLRPAQDSAPTSRPPTQHSETRQ